MSDHAIPRARRRLLVTVAAVLVAVVGALAVTARAPAEAVGPGDVDTVYVADGTDFADALMGATLAALDTAPMLGVAPDVIPQETADELDRLTDDGASPLGRIVVFGGTAAVSTDVVDQLGAWADSVERLKGDSRWGTFAAISQALPDAVAEADNADTLDGLDATDFVRAPGPTDTRWCMVKDISLYGGDADTEIATIRSGGAQFRAAWSASGGASLGCGIELAPGEQLQTVTAYLYDGGGTDVTSCIVTFQPFPGDAGQWTAVPGQDGANDGSYELVLEPGDFTDDSTLGPVDAPTGVSTTCGFESTAGSPSIGLQGVRYEVATTAE